MSKNSSGERASPPADPLRRDIRSPGAWLYLSCYLMLGCSVVLIVLQQFVEGVKVTWWLPVLAIVYALFLLRRQQAREQTGPQGPG